MESSASNCNEVCRDGTDIDMLTRAKQCEKYLMNTWGRLQFVCETNDMSRATCRINYCINKWIKMSPSQRKITVHVPVYRVSVREGEREEVEWISNTLSNTSENCHSLLSSTRLSQVMSRIHFAGFCGQAFRSRDAPPRREMSTLALQNL